MMVGLSFFRSFLQTIKAVFTDKGVFLMLVFAPILYGFFYPWPYSSEVVEHVPVGIVDNDHSPLSKKIVHYASASPYLETYSFLNNQQAKEAMWENQIAGYMIIPQGLQENVTLGRPASVSVLGNAGYFILNKNVQLGFSQAVGTVSAGIEVKRNVAHGAYLETAKTNTQAVPLRIQPLYNTHEGYGAYVVPAVSILILQQTLLMAAALLVGTWYEQRKHYMTMKGWLGRIFALSTISFMVGCFYYGWIFYLNDYAHGNNLLGSLLFLAIFCPTVATLGCVLGLWFKQRERSLQILIFSSLPLFFISGYPWPVSQLPELLQWVRWLVPSTSGMNASVQLNQMGASVGQVAHYLYALLALWAIYFILLWRLEYKNRSVF